MMTADYADILMIFCLYFMGFSIFLLRRDAIVFLREMSKAQSCKDCESELKMVQEIKDHPMICYVGILYFFLMGTLLLAALF